MPLPIRSPGTESPDGASFLEIVHGVADGDLSPAAGIPGHKAFHDAARGLGAVVVHAPEVPLYSRGTPADTTGISFRFYCA